jgi:electron transport complex protein RnfC
MNKPLFERIVTVSGKSLRNPSNFLVRIGTPVSELINATGGLPGDTGKIINGGPMMGKEISDIEIPVIKGTTGILILPKSEIKNLKTINCIRCAKCVDACPMGFEPYMLALLSENSNFKRIEKEIIMDCIECNSCAYICPSGRPVLDLIRQGKMKVKEIKNKSNN